MNHRPTPAERTTAMTDETRIEKVTPTRSRPTTARKTAAQRKAEAAGTTAAKAPRKPADHASAKTDVKKPKTVDIEWREDPETKEPYVYRLDPENFDDLDYVDALISMETADSEAQASTYAFVALKAVLGPENFALYKQREKLTQTRATFSQSIAFFNSMMEQMKKGNSGPSPAA